MWLFIPSENGGVQVAGEGDSWTSVVKGESFQKSSAPEEKTLPKQWAKGKGRQLGRREGKQVAVITVCHRRVVGESVRILNRSLRWMLMPCFYSEESHIWRDCQLRPSPNSAESWSCALGQTED